MLVIVDTNLLLRFAEIKHQHHRIAVEAMQSLRLAGHELCLVPQNHYEFWVVATRPIALNGLGMSPAEAGKALDNMIPPLFRILRDERAIYDNWRSIVSKDSVQGKNAHDARLVAAMIRHRVKHILTFNVSDFERYSEIVVLNPLSYAKQ